MSTIRLAETDAEILACFDVVHELRPQVAREDFVARIRLQEKEGYRLVYLADANGAAAVAGFRIATYLAWGRAVYVDDLVTTERSRSSGHGHALLIWLRAYGEREGCGELHLDSGTFRGAAHRFYFRERMEISAYHFSCALGERTR